MSIDAGAIYEKVKQIIVQRLSVDADEVVAASQFGDDLGADSLDSVELIMSFEEAFDLEISDEDAQKLVTVNDAVEYIVRELKQIK